MHGRSYCPEMSLFLSKHLVPPTNSYRNKELVRCLLIMDGHIDQVMDEDELSRQAELYHDDDDEYDYRVQVLDPLDTCYLNMLTINEAREIGFRTLDDGMRAAVYYMMDPMGDKHNLSTLLHNLCDAQEHL